MYVDKARLKSAVLDLAGNFVFETVQVEDVDILIVFSTAVGWPFKSSSRSTKNTSFYDVSKWHHLTGIRDFAAPRRSLLRHQ